MMALASSSVLPRMMISWIIALSFALSSPAWVTMGLRAIKALANLSLFSFNWILPSWREVFWRVMPITWVTMTTAKAQVKMAKGNWMEGEELG